MNKDIRAKLDAAVLKPRLTTSNYYENQAAKDLESEGYTVIRNGWPDFFCFRDVNGVREYLGVEVKSAGNRVSKRQKRMAESLPFRVIARTYSDLR